MLASESDSVREYARNVGFERQNQAWILSPFDTWERNPFYSGPAEPHPESYEDDGEEYGYCDEEIAARNLFVNNITDLNDLDDIPY